MAKSKSGGTRAYIRGKIGADVYSIGKDGKGAKQQVVRSLAEVVSNPQTVAQMRGRMIMSTVMQTVSALSPIIDHSFDNVPNGQPSISEFISRNYALVKADVAAHPASDFNFGINKYQEKGSRGGAYIISDGKVEVPITVSQSYTQDTPTISVLMSPSSATCQMALDSLGVAVGDYITLILIKNPNGELEYARFHVNQPADPSALLTSELAEAMFTIEGSIYAGVTYAEGKLSLIITETCYSFGAIWSKKTAEGWQHNKATMKLGATLSSSADVALPTYPQGASRFLNGGDI